MEVNADSVLSVDDMLARAKANAGKKSTAGMTKIQKMLAEREESDTIDLSPVARYLYEQDKANSKKSDKPYTEQDWYIKAKVSQLRAELQLYTNLPGLDPSGAIMDSLSKEITGLVKKQADAIKAKQAEGEAKQKELDALQAAAYKGLTAEQMLKRLDGEDQSTQLSAAQKSAVNAMLKKVGSTLNTSA